MVDDVMRQEAPYPTILASVVQRLRYRPGWTFELADLQRDDDHGRGEARGLTLAILADTMDAYHPDRRRPVMHYFIVPAATYDERSWMRWVFDRILDIETHEACEYFTLIWNSHREAEYGDLVVDEVVRPYAPAHGPGNDPYTVRELSTELDQRTSFRGVVKEPDTF